MCSWHFNLLVWCHIILSCLFYRPDMPLNYWQMNYGRETMMFLILMSNKYVLSYSLMLRPNLWYAEPVQSLFFLFPGIQCNLGSIVCLCRMWLKRPRSGMLELVFLELRLHCWSLLFLVCDAIPSFLLWLHIQLSK